MRVIAAEIFSGRDGNRFGFQKIHRELKAVIGEGVALGVNIKSTFRFTRDFEA